MHVARSQNRRPTPANTSIAAMVQSVSSTNLREYVEMLSFPRHYVAERQANHQARNLLRQLLQSFGYSPVLQGRYDNIVAISGTTPAPPYLLLGAHYDSVPGTPGADDNASAVAVCLECARILKQHDIGSTMIVLFNREEDGLLGSRGFVADLPNRPDWAVAEAHVFEMVGYCTHEPNSQRMPPGLPGILAPTVGDFIGLIANRHSNAIAESLLSLAATYVPQSSLIALKMYLGIEQYFGHLHRSDHAPFWEAGIPALMWTDTSEFRNRNYHRASDTPDTLDYDFLTQVTQIALARAVARNMEQH